MNDNPRKRLDITDVCDILKLSKPTIYRRIKEGLLPEPTKDGRRSFWQSQDISNYLDTKKTA